MDYRRFEQLRAPALAELETRLDRAAERPADVGFEELEELAVLYRQVLHDASFAAVRFPDTSLARRLRRAALRANRWLRREGRSRLPSPWSFVTEVFPATFQRLLPQVGIAGALFALAAFFGFAIAAVEPAAASLFLPAAALDGLTRGELWTDSVFAMAPSGVISSQIATNNLSVAITAWAGGALAGLGSLWISLLNGVMLGSVLAATAHYSMMSELLEFVAAHGPLEISLILVSAGAGLHLGTAWVRATDAPRTEVLARAGRDSLVVVLGCLPWILLLGFVEGFVSPSASVPLAVKVAVGLALEILFLLWAFSAPGPPRLAPATSSREGSP